MKTKKMITYIMAALAAALFLGEPIVLMADQPAAPAAPAVSETADQPQLVKDQTTAQGTIIVEKNKMGMVIGYAIQEAGGQSAKLSKQGQGMALRKMVGKKVEVVGTLEESHGQKTITVTEFKEIE